MSKKEVESNDDNVATDIAEMTSVLGDSYDEESIEKDSKDEDSIEESEEESQEDEEDEGEEEKDQENSDDDEEEEGEDDEEEDEEGSELSKIVNEQKEQIAELLTVVNKLLSKEGKEDTKDKKEEKIDFFKTPEFDSFITELEYNNDEAEAFKSLLTSYGKQIHNETVNKIMEVTPDLISKNMKTRSSSDKLKTDFYTAHPALSHVKKYVATTAKELAEKAGPGFNMQKILDKAATVVYKELGIKKTKGKTNKNSSETGKVKKKPAFVKPKGARKGSKKKATGMQSEIDDMNEVLQ